MGAQSIKIPVELELRQLQGSIETLKKALDKIDPGSKVYDKLLKALDKVEQKYNSLENASKRTFKNTTEINKFEQSFEKVANSIDDLASDFKRIKFEDLTSDIFSQDDVDRIQKASTKIKDVQNEISSLKVEKLKELANSSTEIQQIFDDLKIDPDVSGFEDSLNKIKKNITELKRSITSLKKKRDTKQQKETELDTKIAGISSLSTKGNLAQKFGAQFFDKSGTKYKAGGKQLLTEYLAQLGLKPTDIAKVQNATASELEKFANEIIKKLQSTVPQLKTEKANIQTEISDITKQINTKTTDLNQKTNAVSSIEGINPAIKAELETLQLKLQEAQAEMVKLKNELAQLRGPAGEAGDAIKGAGNASEEAREKFEDTRASAQKLAAATEKLDNIKFAIKNWFGFNEVINMSKNAVRNAITHIRELDKTMTEIAIVTDMTQQELWGQIDVYSALAQQYGATTKGVYEVSQLYYQQGLQTAEVMDLTSETLKMARISSLSYSDATDYMTVALRGFKLEMSDAQNIVDVYSNIAAVSASDTEELAVAMSKTASSAEAVGASFENTTAMIALMVETTREAPENIGSAMKSIISRYGEMTSDPMKLVDSEGEEMSLNKVDKALQSVGISLQDAQGQFRNFDDVILELAESWNTIDKNTQRYIATVMAGNRQQSRFLALVGNYDRLKELTEEAANSEDAAQLQILKTMDSIETKLNQLKVTYQQFYADTGVEELIKGVIDGITSVIDNLNGIPKTFDKIPVAALIMSSSLIMVVKSIALRIIGEVSRAMEEAKAEATNKSGEAGKTAGQKFVQSFKNELSQLTGNGKKEGLKGLFYFAGDTDSSISQALRGITSALTTVSFLIDQNTRKGQIFASSMQLAAGVLQGVQATSMAIQGSAGWVGLALTAATTLITAISTFNETAEEKIERLSKAAQEASDKALLAKKDYKDLDSGIKKLEQLEEKRYESAEAAEEYRTAVDELANQYPELIKSYDATNNAVLDASAQERLLAELRRDSADATLEAALAEAKLKEEELKNKKDELTEEIETERSSINLSQLIGLKNRQTTLQNAKDLIEAEGEDASAWDRVYGDQIGDKLYYLNENNQAEEIGNYLELYEAAEKLANATTIEEYIAALEQVNTLFSDYPQLLDGIIGEASGEILKLQGEVLDANAALKQSAKKVISSKLVSDFDTMKIIEDNSGLFSIASTILEESFDESGIEKVSEWIESQNYKDEAKIIMEEVSNYWDSLTSSKQQIFQQMFENPEQYSGEAIIQKLNITDTEIQDYIRSYYEDIYTNNKERIKNLFNETFKNYSSSDIQKEFLSRIEAEDSMTEDQADFYSSAIEQTNKYIEEGFKNQANDYLEQITLLIDIINSLNLDEDVKNELYTLMNQQDLSTWEGIQSFIKAIQETEAFKDIDISNLEKVLTNLGYSLIENLTVGISSVEDKIVEKIKTINESLEDMAGELSAQDAFSAYKKMKSVDETIPAFSEVYKQSEEDPTKYILSDVEYLNKYREEQIKALEEESQHLREKLAEAEHLESIEEEISSDLDKEKFKEVIKAKDENAAKVYEELGIWEQVWALYNEGSYEFNEINALISEKVAEEKANIAALEALGADSSLASQITSNLDIGEFTEATKIAGDNSQWINYINRTKEEAYDTLLQDFLSGGVKLVEEESYKYVGEVKSAANNIISSTDPIATAKELALVAGYTIEEINNVILQATEESTKQTIGAAQDALKNLSFIDKNTAYGSLEDIEALASALEIDLDTLGAVYNTNLDAYVFDTDKLGDKLNSIANQDKIILEAQLNFLNEILGHLENAFDGSLDFGNIATLSEMLGQFGIQVDESDFTRMEEGFEISRQKAFDIVYALKEIDSISAKTMIGNLAEQLEEAGSGYEDVASTMKTIAELNRELADVPVSSERRAELERELAVAEEILHVRSQDPDSFSFMDKDLPTGMQGPENYWNSVGEAYKVMNESAKSGYMEIQDYVNIVNQMEAMAIAAGQEFSIGGMNAAQLIEKGMSSLKNIDGEGVKIAMEGVGIDFANAATDMGLSFDDGIKEVAKSQIKMLDAAIRMLEAMVAMENIDTDGSGYLEAGEIFANDVDASEGWHKNVEEWADNLEDSAGKISIGGKSLLEALASLDPKQAEQALNRLMSIDWTGDIDIASQIQSVLSAYFPDVDITQGKSVFDILEIPDDADTKAEHFTEWLNKVGLAAENYDLLKKALDNNYKIGTEGSLFQSIEKMLGLEEGDNRFENLYSSLKNLGYGIQDAIQLWDQLEFKDGKILYNGESYSTINEVIAASQEVLQSTSSATSNTSTVTPIDSIGEIGFSEIKNLDYELTFNENKKEATLKWDGQTIKTIVKNKDEAVEWAKKIITFDLGQTSNLLNIDLGQGTLSTISEGQSINYKYSIIENGKFAQITIGEKTWATSINENFDKDTFIKNSFNSWAKDNGIKEPLINNINEQTILSLEDGTSIEFDVFYDAKTQSYSGKINGQEVVSSNTKEGVLNYLKAKFELLNKPSLEEITREEFLSDGTSITVSISYDATTGLYTAKIGATEIGSYNTKEKAETALTEKIEELNSLSINLGETKTISLSDGTSIKVSLTYDATTGLFIASIDGKSYNFATKDAAIKYIENSIKILNQLSFPKNENEPVSLEDGTAVDIKISYDAKTGLYTASLEGYGTCSASSKEIIKQFLENGIKRLNELSLTNKIEKETEDTVEGSSNIVVNYNSKVKLTADAATIDTSNLKSAIVSAIEEMEIPSITKTVSVGINGANGANEIDYSLPNPNKMDEGYGAYQFYTQNEQGEWKPYDNTYFYGYDYEDVYDTMGNGGFYKGIEGLGMSDGIIVEKDRAGEIIGALDNKTREERGTEDLQPKEATITAEQVQVKGEQKSEEPFPKSETPAATPVTQPEGETPTTIDAQDLQLETGEFAAEAGTLNANADNITVEGFDGTGGEGGNGGGGGSTDGSTGGKTSGGTGGSSDVEYREAYIALEGIGSAAIDGANQAKTAYDGVGADIATAAQTAGQQAGSAIQAGLDKIDPPTPVIKVSYPENISIGATATIRVTASVTGGATATASIEGTKTFSKGNVALAKGTGNALVTGRKTLMGELGPELVVAGGRYFTVGNNGAEFVDLPDDAIVFNHLQTQKLLGSSGRMVGTGKPVTNEKKATSLATGNMSGPAMASASAALAQLRQIRAMWQSMLNASAKDLGSLAGAGGGGGGGGGGGDEVAAVLGDLDRWYNLLRQIDSLEQHITLEQAKRANMKSGYDIVKSMEKELDMLKKQKAAYEELAKRQKEYYDLRRQDLLNSDYSNIFTYDEHGLMQYVEGEGKGLDILATLNATDANGKAKMNAKQQLAYLQSIGFDISVLATNADGTKAKKPEEQMQNFWDGIDGWMEEMDSLYDSYHDAAISSEEAAEAMAEILQEYIDNQLEVEQKLMQAIEDREQAEIDRIQDEKEALEEASQAYIDGLNDALSKERDMYSKNQNAEETAKLQRRLAVLQRSGGSASEIKSLQDQIDSRMQDEYFNKMQEQIDAVQEASDNQLEKLQNQIDIMTESLEYQKENGLLWQEVYAMMAEWSPEQMLAFIEQYTESYQQNSQTQNEQDSQETQTQLEMHAAHQAGQAFDTYASSEAVTGSYDAETIEANSDDAKQAYIDTIVEGGTQEEAEAAANQVFAGGNADRELAAIAAIVGNLGKDEELKQAYLTAFENTEGSNAEKQLAGKKAMIEKLKNSDEGRGPGDVQRTLNQKTNLYETNAMRDSRNNIIGTVLERSIPKGSTVTIHSAGMDSTGLPTRGIFEASYGGKRGYIYAGHIDNCLDLFTKYQLADKIKNLPSYASGGDIDFTGLAMVHGSKNHPENILSAEHTALLKQGIFSNSNHSLAATVAAIQEMVKEMASSGVANSGEQIIIQQAIVNIEPGVIASDYDARRAGELALEEMIRISRKTTNRSLSRR